ncbi:MAG: hypothetical protein A2V84_03160 [Chloroflexi bacterium RBG_16_70_13]|nr:MAG: hypothetical protein A2V84_03160 [Chloroflexi bacterium RBG_16_70_13]
MSTLPSLGPRGEGWVAIQLAIFAVIALAGLALPGSLDEPAATLTSVAGWALVAAGGALAVAGLVGLQGGDALTAVPHPRDEARLVVNGAYRFARHPVYGGLVVAAVGWAAARGSFAALAGRPCSSSSSTPSAGARKPGWRRDSPGTPSIAPGRGGSSPGSTDGKRTRNGPEGGCPRGRAGGTSPERAATAAG